MTCYVRIKQEDERKLRDAQRLTQTREIEKKQQIRDRWSQGQREKMEDSQLRAVEYGHLTRNKAEESRKKREKDIRTVARQNLASQPVQISSPRIESLSTLTTSKKLKKSKTSASHYGAPQNNDYVSPLNNIKKMEVGRREEGRGYGGGNRLEEEEELSAKASGLPVSLSIGQKNIAVLLVAKNNSNRQISFSFTVTATDSKGNSLEVKIEPKNATLEAGAEASANATFDLEETTAKGPLLFAYFISESAFHLDKKSAKSLVATLTSQVKTPMKLGYKKGSAVFAGQKDGKEKLCITVDNLGESGGLLSVKSSICYGKDKKKERAPLFENQKIKGLEKNVVLKFFPAKKMEIENLEISFVGVDSNGKPYGERIAQKEK